MKLTLDDQAGLLIQDDGNEIRQFPLYSREAFELLSHYWVKVGWDQRYSYTFSWMGRPIIQLPEDMVRTQEVLYRVQPDVIVETGVAHGGSLIYYASLCKAMGRGRVIGVDVEIRPANRKSIESHDLSSWITLIEGDSVAPEVVAGVKSLIQPHETALVILDSCHTKAHVRRELEAYYDVVTPGSYLVATDGIMQELDDVPRGEPAWKTDNPAAAAAEFAQAHPEFVLEQPAWEFNESPLKRNITHWPAAWLRRKSAGE